MADAELAGVIRLTEWDSNRDLDFLSPEVKSTCRDNPAFSALKLLEAEPAALTSPRCGS